MNRKILIASDSYKRTISSYEVGEIIKERLLLVEPSLEIDIMTIADGGEGSLESIASKVKGQYILKTITGPNKTLIESKYYLDPKQNAYIESAKACGVSITNKGSTPMETTSYGIGELIVDAINRGAKTIYLCLGGISTTDGGAGLLSALGCKFINDKNETFIPTGGTLKAIVSIDKKELEQRIKGIKFYSLVDVDNPLLGEIGASHMFARQKGASPEEILLLEEGMTHYVDVVKKQYDKDINNIKGAGAAGGLGAGTSFFLNSELLSGIETILDIVNINSYIQNSDVVIVGEGRIDKQSLHGKAISGVTNRAKKYNKKVIAVVGASTLTEEEIILSKIDKILVTGDPNIPFDKTRKTSIENLTDCIDKNAREIIE